MRSRRRWSSGRREGVPANPRAWLVSTGRFKAIDRVRRRARFDASLGELAERLDAEAREAEDRALDLEARGGRPAAPDLHLLPPGAAARRADRAHAARGLRPDDGGDRARVSRRRRRPSRSGSSAPRRRSATRGFRIRCRRAPSFPNGSTRVLHVIYLVFNEGYAASSGDVADATRSVGGSDSAGTAAGGTAAGARGDGPARADAAARVAARGADVAGRRAGAARRAGSVAVESRADREGCALVERALASRRFGPYTLQAAIAAVHAEAPTAAATDWRQIVGLYDVLLRADPVAGRGAEPRRRDRDARRAGGRAGADRRRSSRAAISPTTRWRTPRAPICAAVSAAPRRRARPTSARWRYASGPAAPVPRAAPPGGAWLLRWLAPEVPATFVRRGAASGKRVEKSATPSSSRRRRSCHQRRPRRGTSRGRCPCRRTNTAGAPIRRDRTAGGREAHGATWRHLSTTSQNTCIFSADRNAGATQRHPFQVPRRAAQVVSG